MQWIVKFKDYEGLERATQPFSSKDSAELAKLIIQTYPWISNVRVEEADQKAGSYDQT